MATSYWFPAKRYGWGWSLPCAWQGWVVLVLWTAALGAGLWWRHASATVGAAAFVAGMSGILVLICWLTGEPPRWRWGEPRPDAPPGEQHSRKSR